MDFSKRKLPLKAASQLLRSPIESVSAYALMLAPVYLFLKKNEKFISVKSPLDFFSPDELDRYKKSHDYFYIPQFIQSIVPLQEIARRLRLLLGWKPRSKSKEQAQPVPPTPYEISDSVLRLIGPLWSETGAIEPFFVAAFVNDLCDLLPSEILYLARDESVKKYEFSILKTDWTVFLALHLGYNDIDFLNRLRLYGFIRSMRWQEGRFLKNLENQQNVKTYQKILGQMKTPELVELFQMTDATFYDPKLRELRHAFFDQRYERICQKMQSRLMRVGSEMQALINPAPSIYGERGFISE